MNKGYDETSATDIERYGKKLVGRTFRQIVEADSHNTSATINSDGGFDKKGGLGILLEERYFHYKANNDARPDFDEAGVELKVTPYKINSKNEKVAKERLVISMIDYMNVVNESFDDSHMWLKTRLMLLVYYLYEKEIRDRLDYRIDYVSLFTPSKEDIAIIKADFETIVEKIKSGKAHELSEGDTMYLAACTKASDSNIRRMQPYSDVPAKPRAFSLKSSYMTYVLNNYIIPSEHKVDAIVSDGKIVSFGKYVTDKISQYKGRSIENLCDIFNISPENRDFKSVGAVLVYRILGVKSNSAEEFIKAGIRVKTIRVRNNGTIKESMSFPTMKFREMAQEEWEDSAFYHYLTETKFFFVIYKEDNEGVLRLAGCKFWNIPYDDLKEVEIVWKKTKQLINGELQTYIIDGKYKSNFPKQSENAVCHVRPHGKNASDVDILPDGRLFPKQCFWLNREYVRQQISDLID